MIGVLQAVRRADPVGGGAIHRRRRSPALILGLDMVLSDVHDLVMSDDRLAVDAPRHPLTYAYNKLKVKLKQVVPASDRKDYDIARTALKNVGYSPQEAWIIGSYRWRKADSSDLQLLIHFARKRKNAELFKGGAPKAVIGGAVDRGVVLDWVAANLSVSDVDLDSSPGSAALSMLRWAKGAGESAFWTMWSRYMEKRNVGIGPKFSSSKAEDESNMTIAEFLRSQEYEDASEAEEVCTEGEGQGS